jgi:hypothetical protein
LDLTVLINNNANCNPNSGQISGVAQNGTPPYLYQVTTTAAPPAESDPNWAPNNVFDLDAGNYYVHTIDAYGCVVSELVALPEDPSPTISATVTDSCILTDGEFSIDVTLDSPGIPPYSYSIDGGAFQTFNAPFTINNLFSGTHTIEIQDANGCGNLVSVDILPPLTVTPSLVANASCNDDDGEVSIATTGGSGNYTYSINPLPASVSIVSNTITGIPSGTYTITVLDNITGCSEDVDITIPSATPPSISVTPNTITCFGDNSGSLEFSVNGYSGNYASQVFDAMGVSMTGLVNTNTSSGPVTVNGLTAGAYDTKL